MILGVNIDHVATLRQARLGDDPDPLMAAPLAIMGGADGITLHLREDRRHVNDRDLWLLRESVQVELNMEMAATKEMLEIAAEVKPDMVTLVPEKRQELTTEGGLDIRKKKTQTKKAIEKLHKAGIPVSLFINPDPDDIAASKEAGADMVEIHTGMYADAQRGRKQYKELRRVEDAVAAAHDLGIVVNVGHGLNFHNVKPVASIEGIRGLYIGHSIISRAVLIGLMQAVRDMKALIRECQ
ncbi:pyridoxine 5'-phosphate synthase [Nitrospirota bacterium]